MICLFIVEGAFSVCSDSGMTFLRTYSEFFLCCIIFRLEVLCNATFQEFRGGFVGSVEF